jgi:hypothetical protein
VKRTGFLLTGLFLAGLAAASAQQLEPRAYTPLPINMNFVGLPFVHQTGSVVTDPTAPIQNVDAKINFLAPVYVRTFGFFGRSASAGLALPYVWGTVSGEVFEQARTITRSGQGDLQLRLMSNIFGGPALTGPELARAPMKTTLGATLVVSMPTGQYDGTKLINIGTNRWAFKPELGLSIPVAHWTFDLYAGAWLFTANDNYFGGNRRTQQPLYTLQGHVGYTFRPGLWLALDGTWYSGGQTSLNGVLEANRQDNARIGATFAVPLGRGHSLKAAWGRGATVRIGQDFTTYGVTYQYIWF